jgi:chromosome partitioning protein
MSLQRILVTNAKGGCGKTTITTNIASHYARLGKNVRLFDHDTQGSSLAWINRRGEDLAPIAGVDASRNLDHRLTRSWQLRVPPETDVAIIDSPAGTDITELAALFQPNDSILIPVLPSPIDIHATAHFIKALLTTGRARKKMVRLAVVANRVRKNTLMYHSLERFLFGLNIPFISSLRDT